MFFSYWVQRRSHDFVVVATTVNKCISLFRGDIYAQLDRAREVGKKKKELLGLQITGA